MAAFRRHPVGGVTADDLDVIGDPGVTGPVDQPDRLAAAAQRLVGGRPMAPVPKMTCRAAVMADYICTEQYLWGLHRVLDGITGCTAEHAMMGAPEGLPGSKTHWS